MNEINYKETIGQILKDFRKERGLTTYKIAQKGKIQIGQVKDIESGKKNYTIDTFLGYIHGCDLHINEHDFKELIKKKRTRKRPGK